jgi:DNA-binding transcriptional LysR family regulator
MDGTIRLDDIRLFVRVAEAKSFTAAAHRLAIPKQTLSRRVAEFERALGVRLMHRTTRRLHLTELGAAYAERGAEMLRIAEEAHRALRDAQDSPRGTLRITADPVFGEAFLPALVVHEGIARGA